MHNTRSIAILSVCQTSGADNVVCGRHESPHRQVTSPEIYDILEMF